VNEDSEPTSKSYSGPKLGVNEDSEPLYKYFHSNDLKILFYP